jgi:hypothetical protein
MEQSKDTASKTSTSTTATCKANFFDNSNQEAARMRQAAADLALQETLNWLETGNTETTPKTVLRFNRPCPRRPSRVAWGRTKLTLRQG